jgi:hypothetical protein
MISLLVTVGMRATPRNADVSTVDDLLSTLDHLERWPNVEHKASPRATRRASSHLRRLPVVP